MSKNHITLEDRPRTSVWIARTFGGKIEDFDHITEQPGQFPSCLFREGPKGLVRPYASFLKLANFGSSPDKPRIGARP